MGVRYRSEFTNDTGVDYQIDIIDTSFGGVFGTFDVSSKGYFCTIDAESDDRLEPIKSQIFGVDANVTLNDTNFEVLINDMVASDGGRFYMAIYKAGSFERGGPIQTDSIEWPDDEPYFFKITATDGLGQLKDIQYDNAGTLYDTEQTFIDIILNCLQHTGVPGNVIGSGVDFLKTKVDWYESNMTASAANDPLDLSRIDSRTFWVPADDDAETDYESMYCMDVLRNVLTGWNCRLIMDDGVFQVIQLNEYDNASVNYRIYDSAGNRNSSGSENWDVTVNQTTTARLATPQTTFRPAVRKAVAKYDHRLGYNILPEQLTYDSNTNFTWNRIFGGSGTNHQLKVTGTIRFTITNRRGTTLSNFCKGMAMTLRVGSNYVLKDKTNQTISWSPGASVAMFTTRPVASLPNGYQITLDVNVDFTTPEIPASSSANNYLQLEPTNYWFNPFQNMNTIVPATTYIGPESNPWAGAYAGDLVVQYEVFEMFVQWLPQGRYPDTIETFASENAPSGTPITESNTVDVDPTILFGTPVGSEPGAVQVYDGASWVDSTASWDVGASGSYNMTQLLTREIVAGQHGPVDLLSATIWKNILPTSRILIGTKYYMFNGGDFDAERDEWSGTWILCDRDNSILSDDTPVGNSPERLGGPGSGNSNSLVTELSNKVYNHLTTYKNISGITTTIAALTAGTGTNVVGISQIGVAPTIEAGDTFFIEDPETGLRDSFVCATSPTAVTNLLFFNFKSPLVNLGVGSIVSYPFKNLLRDTKNDGVDGTTGAVTLSVGTLSANTLEYRFANGMVFCSGELVVATVSSTGTTAAQLTVTLPYNVKAATVVAGQMTIYSSASLLKRIVVMEDKLFATAGSSLTVRFITNLNTAAVMLDTDLAVGDKLNWWLKYQKS